MSLQCDLEQVLVEALVVILFQFGFSAGSCGVASEEHVVLGWVEETHSGFKSWM
jgi:hypothetical protein